MSGPLILTFSCADRHGIVARVPGYLFAAGGNILEAQQFEDTAAGRFFMRVVFDPRGRIAADLRNGFGGIAGELAMDWRLRERDARPKVVIMVSRFDHCLADLLYRRRIGELAMEVTAIVANHPRAALAGALNGEASFHHLPVTPPTRPAQEAAVRALIKNSGAELVILARYMQVLSDGMAEWLEGRCINIHHSFLPGFKGAKPYHQAHARGVKMIGATAHYVTRALDEGPIIHHDVEPTEHADTPDDLVRKGRDIERRVLAEAVRLHLENRVLLNGGRTVVFRG